MVLPRTETPVIIPAYKAESSIARTLRSLPKSGIEPIVAVNGERDATGEIADSFGATVHHFEEQGKLPAIQRVLKGLGDRAFKPVIILDADTRPVFPERWHQSILRTLDDGRHHVPAAVGGPVLFTEGGVLNATVTSAVRFRRAHNEPVWTGDVLGAAGPNMALHLRTQDAADDIMNLPHIWPGEDWAILEQVRNRGGNVYQSTALAMLSLTPASDSWPTVLERIRIGREESRRRITDHYIARAATSSLSYDEFRKSTETVSE